MKANEFEFEKIINIKKLEVSFIKEVNETFDGLVLYFQQYSNIVSTDIFDYLKLYFNELREFFIHMFIPKTVIEFKFNTILRYIQFIYDSDYAEDNLEYLLYVEMILLYNLKEYAEKFEYYEICGNIQLYLDFKEAYKNKYKKRLV